MDNRWIWVDDHTKLHKAKAAMGRSSLISIDTEYDSFRYFREKLCLIQVKADDETFLFDPLGNLDLSFLGESFADPRVLKILHAGDNDIRILKRDYGMEFKNIFDTHRAAGLLGCQYLSLSTLINQYLDIEFVKSKKIQRSNWDARPLKDEQIAYAVQDTAHLVDLYLILEREIESRGLQARAAEVFRGAAMAEWRERSLDRRGHEKIKGYETLTAQERGRLKKLFFWRFMKAKEIDRALFMILSDNDLIVLAKIEATSRQSLIEKGVLSPGREHAFGEELIDILTDSD